MQFSVPQFVEVKDKVFGPLTVAQFLYSIIGIGLGLIEYFTLPIPIFVLLVIPTVAIFAALAFYKVNGRPFLFFVVNAGNFVLKPTHRLWKRDPLLPRIRARKAVDREEKIQRGVIKKEGLERLSHILDFEIKLGESIVPEEKQKELYPDLY